MQIKDTTYITTSMIFIIIISLLFYNFPQWDLTVSSYFFDSTQQKFPIDKNIFYQTIRNIGMVLVIIVTSFCVYGVWRLPNYRHRCAYLLGGLIIGPGLLINSLLKEYWGRARPYQIKEFGGSSEFSLPWQFSDACQSNCSFVSGEAAASFWLMIAITLLCSQHYRRFAFILTSGWCFLLSALRVAMGRHFLSDTVLSWGLCGLTMALLYFFFCRYSCIAQQKPLT